MDPLSVSASIVALLQLSSTVIKYLSDVKGGPKELQRIRLEISSVLNLLITLQDQADQATVGDGCSSTLRSLNVPNGPFQQFHSALERLASRLAPVEGWKKVGKAFKWPFEREEMSDILNTIERLKTFLSLARQNDHIALSKATKIKLEAMNAEVNEISTGVSKLQTGPTYNDIRRWLSAPNPSSNYNRALKDRHATTGDWFLKSKAYQDWLSETYSLLWLHGIPGCGKTVLSSAIIQNTFEYCKNRTNSVVLYFYFDFNDFQKQQHGQMVRSLVSQLLSYDHTVPSELSGLYSSCMSGERQPSLENLLATLHRMMTAFGQAYVILDALDECEDVLEALTTIEAIRSWTDVKCSILVMSRREKDIEDGFMSSSGAAETVRIQSALVDIDIRRYVGERLRTDRRLKRWQREQFEIEDALMRQADGMFRWAACQLDALCNCRSVHQLRKALSSLPETLDRTYDQILGKIKAEDYQFAAKILRWLTYSVRPLRLEEIAEVIAIDSNSSPPFDLSKRFEYPSDILEICSSLVSVEDVETQRHHQNEVDIGTDANEDADSYNDRWSDIVARGVNNAPHHKTERYRKAQIRLAHFSVKEYLVSDRIQHSPAFAYSLKEEVSNESIAADCLIYLLHLIEPDNRRSELTIVEYPLARYAARYWTDHIHFVKGPKSVALTLVQELFMKREDIFVNWIQLWNPDRSSWSSRTQVRMRIGPPLYFASLLGFLESVETLIENGADVNVQAGSYGNALIAASASGHTDIVLLLVEKGATISSHGVVYGTSALVAASFEGHMDIVQLLVNKGADINAQNRSDLGFALEAASTAGHIEILQFLLDRTAPSEALWVQDALKKACSNGDAGMVQILLDRGAVVDPMSLLAALREGQKHVLRILLEHGCHLKETDMEGRHVCHYACIIGDLKAVEMLICRGTDLAVRDKQGRNCLHFAASSGNPGNADLVTMLLKHGFDPNSLDINDWTPLHWAAKGGFVKNIRILEDAGAKFSNEKIGGRTPSDVAVFNAYLQKGVQIEAVCDGCEQLIYGSRYRCMDCTDFDYCFKCKHSSNITHPRHEFVFNPTEFELEFLPFCGGCFMNIYGSRYKCLNYQRMDYCLKCKLNLETSHPCHNCIKDPTPAQLREVWGAYDEADALEKHIADASKRTSEPPAWG